MTGAVHQKVQIHSAKIQETAGDHQIQAVGETVLIREILKHQDKGKINFCKKVSTDCRHPKRGFILDG